MLRMVAEGLQTQGTDESVAYNLDVGNWGTGPALPACKLWDVTGGAYTDVSTGKLTGTPTVDGDCILSPLVHSLTAGNLYRLTFQFTLSGNTLSAYVPIAAEL